MKQIMFLLSIIMIIFLHPQPLSAEVGDNAKLQLIANQKSVTAGGEAQYSILYHFPESSLITSGEIVVNLPLNISEASSPNGTLNEGNNTITWNLNAIENNTSGLLRFSVTAPAEIEAGEVISISAKANLNETEITTPNVTVELGTEVHQPFFKGYPDGTFRPNSNITRAETAAVVSRIKDLTDDSSINNRYDDINSSHWAYDYVREVTNAGYMEGYNGNFHPDEPISRAELITLALRLRGVEPVPFSTPLALKDHWANDIIGTADALNFVDITRFENEITADSYMPRDESARMLGLAFYRGKLVDGEINVVQHFPDVSESHWAFHWIEEASKVAHESERKGMGELLIDYMPAKTEPF